MRRSSWAGGGGAPIVPAAPPLPPGLVPPTHPTPPRPPIVPGLPYTPPAAETTKVHFNAQDTEIIGILEADLIHLTTTSGGVGGELTETVFDTTTHADGAIIKLTNATGVSKTITHCSIRGRLVARLSGKLGLLHDAFSDYERIAVDGERLFELANNYIVTAAQVRQIADYSWKFHRAKRHIYTIDMPGTWHWICPGEVYTLQVGGVGQKEYIDSVCVCKDVQESRGVNSLGQTTIALQELYQNWVFDSNALSRFIARGCPGGVKSFPYAVVASQYDPGAADYYCDGTADDVQIQAANDYLVGTYGGGAILLRRGTYNLAATVSLGSNISLGGEGAASILKKNGNFYAISAIGTSGAHLENVTIRDLTVTRDAADTNEVALVVISAADNSGMERCSIVDGYDGGLDLGTCDSGYVQNCDFVDCRSFPIRLTATTNSRCFGNSIRSTGTVLLPITGAINISSCSDTIVSNNSIGPLYSSLIMWVVYVQNTGTGVKIVGNTISDVHDVDDGLSQCGVGIYLANADNCLIEQNSIRDVYATGPNTVKGSAIVLSAASPPDGVTVIGNSCRDNGNLIDRGNCESATPPYLTGETDDNNDNCTFARDATFAHAGTYGYKFVKTNAAGTAARTRFHNHTDAAAADMAGLVAGCSYTLSAWVYIPSASGILGSEITFELDDEDSAATTQAAANTYDAWQLVSVTRTLGASATGVEVAIAAAAAAALNEYFQVDDIRVRPDGTHNEHSSNYSDAGTGTRAENNSWQRPFQT